MLTAELTEPDERAEPTNPKEGIYRVVDPARSHEVIELHLANPADYQVAMAAGWAGPGPHTPHVHAETVGCAGVCPRWRAHILWPLRLLFCFRISQRPLDEVDNQPLIMPAGNRMPGTRIEHDLEILVGPLEFLHELHAILHMHIVVHQAMEEQQFAVEVTGGLHNRGGVVAIRILLRRIHVPLGIDRVVIVPVGDRSARNAGGEELAVRQRIGRHESAVAVPTHADARRIHEWMLCKPPDCRLDVLQLLDAQLAVCGPRGASAFTAGAARIAAKHEEAELRQDLVTRTPGIPAIVDGWAI